VTGEPLTHAQVVEPARKEAASAVPVEQGPLVSVVVPCYNAARFLERTLQSVLEQTHRGLEVIVVDDASTDDSVALTERLTRRDARVRLIRRSRNAGTPGAPRNEGVAVARGEWIAFLDADDLWHPRKLELQLQALREHEALMCSTSMVDFRDETDIAPTEPAGLPIQRVDLGMQLRKYRTPTSSIVVQRDLMRRLPFNEHPSYKAREDTDCFIRAHEEIAYSIKLLHPLVFYRQQGAQISGNKWKMVGRHLAMLKRYRHKSGRGLGAMAYVYTATHFTASIYLRWFRGVL